MGNSLNIESHTKTHVRRQAIGEKEIFSEWGSLNTTLSDLSKIIPREPLLLPVEYNSLYIRRLVQGQT